MFPPLVGPDATPHELIEESWIGGGGGVEVGVAEGLGSAIGLITVVGELVAEALGVYEFASVIVTSIYMVASPAWSTYVDPVAPPIVEYEPPLVEELIH